MRRWTRRSALSRTAADGRAAARRLCFDVTSPTGSPQSGRARIAVVDYGCKRSILRRLAKAGAAVTVVPATTGSGGARGLRRRRALERAGRPRAARRRGGNHPRAARPRCRCSASASATSCSRSPPATRPSSSRSATAARTIRCSRRRRAAYSSRARTTASRSSRRRGGRPPTSRSTTARSRASTTPSSRARSVQFHPEAGPGPHDAWPLLESWVEEVCAGLAKAA